MLVCSHQQPAIVSTILIGLQTGEAAERHLLTLNPKLCGKAAVVNKGTMEVHRLPFLQMGNLASTQETFNKQASAAYDSEFDDE